MSSFADFSDAMAEAVETAARSVVRVEARRRGNASGIAWTADGLVLASDHTVQRDDGLRVGLPSGEVVPAALVGRDPTVDVALLRVDAALAAPEWAGADTVRVGHAVLSVGRHDGPAQAAFGVVERRAGPWRTGAGGRVDAFVETGVRVYPGFSGSALVDARGRVAGMNTSHWGRRASLAIPVETLRRVAAVLAEHGRAARGFLGVASHPVSLADGRTGLVVVEVTAGGPAEAAGVLVGDVLVGLGETAIAGPHDLVTALADTAGQTLELRLVRGGEPRSLEVALGAR